ncbi:MAG: SDR family NAD(P)-dependent oxidoreductase [Opitutaceae bacterium]|nr:SDR family NAD(P)-dependent oxidoreductase [Opitutaceae bacterium]
MPALADQVVIVTGASSGIGEATAQRLARAGARLILTARRSDRLEAMARALDPGGTRILAVAADITLAADRERLVAATLQRFGRIDALVNNAGYGQRGPLERVSIDAVRRNFEVNVFALIALTQQVIPHLRSQGRGRIVNIGSVAGRIARPLSSVYDSTKHALEALNDGLRGELRPFNIDVVLIRPGYIATEFGESAAFASADALNDSGPYAPFVEAYRKGYSRGRRFARPPDTIARLVERALTVARPRTHYSGPAHARVFLFLRWILPARWFDRLVRLKR